jgi:hypothetical protein
VWDSCCVSARAGTPERKSDDVIPQKNVTAQHDNDDDGVSTMAKARLAECLDRIIAEEMSGRETLCPLLTVLSNMLEREEAKY